MTQRFFIVDVEANGESPINGTLVEFGVVDFTTHDWFHAHLWDFVPDPHIPAIPVPTERNPGVTTSVPGSGRYNVASARAVFADLTHWLTVLHPADRHMFVSDNPAYDYMWVACGFDAVGLPNPFGMTGRRIGDLAAGLAGNWRNTSAWKKHRRTRHDHNPVNDAIGNAEALETVLRRHGQRF